MKTKFESKMFVTLKYKDCTWQRNAEETKETYIKLMQKAGIEITHCELIKEMAKSGRHDGYATGNYYLIKGETDTKNIKTKSGKLFHIYHNCRAFGDYFCVAPVLYNQIKILKP